jgi:hypothetical protein
MNRAASLIYSRTLTQIKNHVIDEQGLGDRKHHLECKEHLEGHTKIALKRPSKRLSPAKREKHAK